MITRMITRKPSCYVALLLSTVFFFAAGAMKFPNYAETFTVETKESTAHDIVVQQKIVRDVDLHRSMMLARGPLVHGVMQQIMRCDISPLGWFANIGGADDDHLQCKNFTQDPDPAHCQVVSWEKQMSREY